MSINFIVLASPSGGGKTTVARHLVNKYKQLSFAISATTRNIRKGEQHGKDYYYLSRNEFESLIDDNEFIEFEEIFGNLYGTLKSELEKVKDTEKILVFDIDVKGAMNIKKLYPSNTLLIFVQPPNLQELEKRLRSRGTESEEQLQTRLSRAKMELSYGEEFNQILINDILEKTLKNAEKIIEEIL